MYQNGMTWTIRLTLSDDQHSRALLHDALANKPVSAVRLEPCGANKAEITGEVMVEFGVDDGLAALPRGAAHDQPAGLRGPRRSTGIASESGSSCPALAVTCRRGRLTLAVRHRTQADGPDIRRTLTCGYRLRPPDRCPGHLSISEVLCTEMTELLCSGPGWGVGQDRAVNHQSVHFAGRPAASQRTRKEQDRCR